jgi:hypothetical protein
MNESSNEHIKSLVDLAKALEIYLKNNGVVRVSGLIAEANCASIILRGTSTSFYQKQITQELARSFISGKTKIINQIYVKKIG